MNSDLNMFRCVLMIKARTSELISVTEFSSLNLLSNISDKLFI